MAEPPIRSARAADLPAVARVFLSCWQGPYAVFLPSDMVARYDVGSAEELWRPRFQPSPEPGLLVADLGGGPVAVALVRPGEGHLASLYVAPSAQGAGLGRLLLSRTAALCREELCRHMTWWVFEANAAGRRFYERVGGRPTGRTRVQEQFGLSELEYALDLGS